MPFSLKFKVKKEKQEFDLRLSTIDLAMLYFIKTVFGKNHSLAPPAHRYSYCFTEPLPL
jgi:hypothetical protein